MHNETPILHLIKSGRG